MKTGASAPTLNPCKYRLPRLVNYMKNLDESQAKIGFKQPSHDDPDIIFDEVRLTRYDVARAKLREAEAKRDAILAVPERDADAVRRLLVLERAIERHQNAVKRALTDHQQRLDEIDRYRANEGRTEYNAGRRVVRAKPNATVKSMTTDMQAQHKKDEGWKRKTLSRLRSSGLPEMQVQAELLVRFEARIALRTTKALVDTEESAMKNLPHYGQY